MLSAANNAGVEIKNERSRNEPHRPFWEPSDTLRDIGSVPANRPDQPSAPRTQTRRNERSRHTDPVVCNTIATWQQTCHLMRSNLRSLLANLNLRTPAICIAMPSTNNISSGEFSPVAVRQDLVWENHRTTQLRDRTTGKDLPARGCLRELVLP